MPLASLHAPFDHQDWIFELKYDGFRALGYIDSGQCWLVSRLGTAYKSFAQLCAAIGAAIPGQAVLAGEIVHLDAEGKPRFYDLMRRRNRQHYYAFDLLWLDGHDLRELRLIKRKQRLKRLIRPPVLYVDHFEAQGMGLFNAACDNDLEGTVAKLAAGRYEPAATTWVKIKNPTYSQAEGRADFFAVTSTRTKAGPSATGAGVVGAYTVKKLLRP
jgi:bifunctional non-homologous end joining protein LigD